MSFYNYFNPERKKGKSNFYVDYKFKYKNEKEEFFSYNVPFDTYVEGIVSYFDANSVTLDGRDKDVYSVLSGLDALKTIEDEAYFVDFITEKCREDAFEEFTEQKKEDEEYDNTTRST